MYFNCRNFNRKKKPETLNINIQNYFLPRSFELCLKITRSKVCFVTFKKEFKARSRDLHEPRPGPNLSRAWYDPYDPRAGLQPIFFNETCISPGQISLFLVKLVLDVFLHPPPNNFFLNYIWFKTLQKTIFTNALFFFVELLNSDFLMKI